MVPYAIHLNTGNRIPVPAHEFYLSVLTTENVIYNQIFFICNFQSKAEWVDLLQRRRPIRKVKINNSNSSTKSIIKSPPRTTSSSAIE